MDLISTDFSRLSAWYSRYNGMWNVGQGGDNFSAPLRTQEPINLKHTSRISLRRCVHRSLPTPSPNLHADLQHTRFLMLNNKRKPWKTVGFLRAARPRQSFGKGSDALGLGIGHWNAFSFSCVTFRSLGSPTQGYASSSPIVDRLRYRYQIVGKFSMRSIDVDAIVGMCVSPR